jgi:hypothetical protein
MVVAMSGDHDLVAHLYAVTLQLMRDQGQVFLPLEVVRERLGWSAELMAQVVDHCVARDPVAAGALRADWMDDGERPAFGASGQRMIGIRPAAA